MLTIPWNPLRAILLSSLGSLLPAPAPSAPVPVYLMLPLDTAAARPTVPLERLSALLRRLAAIGVRGVMLDVWWGLCETRPREYDFAAYIAVLELVRDAGLVAQVVMSFHSCGGNVGDSVSVPLPDWVTRAADDAGAWFQDAEGSVNREYLSFGVDHTAFLPSAADASSVKEEPATCTTEVPSTAEAPATTEAPATSMRTPLEAYAGFVDAFMKEIDDAGLTTLLVELQLGMGPCGELRYPSYPLSQGKWLFPGIGEFQCYDKHLLKELENAHTRNEIPLDNIPPQFAGYNARPWESQFFRHSRKTAAGKWFIDWYAGELLRHGEDVLRVVREKTSIQLAVKVSGVHWWYHHSSRAAEATSGYVNSRGSMYGSIAQLCKKYDAVLDFTCLEMRSMDQPLRARCGPRQLVSEVFRAAWEAGVDVAGENALERWDWKAYKQIAKGFRRTKARGVGFTLLRLSDDIGEEGWQNMERLVAELNKI